MPDQIFIAGATARSAAQSASRAGLEVTAADLFGDRDLAACSAVHSIRDYPSGIVAIAKQLSPRRWIYTGGLENAPELVARVSARHVLLGNPPEVLRQVRDPWRVQQVLSDAGLLYPVIRQQAPSAGTGRWLSKSCKSCGGSHVRNWPDERPHVAEGLALTNRVSPVGPRYFQQQVRGAACGALYVAGQGRAGLLGVTRQLSGCRWAGARGYLYVGSVGPLALDARLADQFQRIGQYLTTAFGLQGLFGVDAIVSGERVWTIEINPRFTASVEIHERATGLCALEAHWRACEDSVLPATSQLKMHALHGKAIVYALQDVEVDESICQWIDEQNDRSQLASLADLPRIGMKIAAGHPLVTVLVQGDSAADVYRQLRRKTHQVHRVFGSPGR